MSKQQTRRDIIAERDELRVQLEAAEAKLAEVTEAAASQLNESQEMFDAMKAAHADEIQSKDETIARINDQVGEYAMTVKDLECKLDEAIADASEDRAELEKARAALSDPALVDAALLEGADALPAPLDEDDDIEAESTEPENELQAWEAMGPGDERVKYWNKNKKAILRHLEARNAEEQESE